MSHKGKNGGGKGHEVPVQINQYSTGFIGSADNTTFSTEPDG